MKAGRSPKANSSTATAPAAMVAAATMPPLAARCALSGALASPAPIARSSDSRNRIQKNRRAASASETSSTGTGSPAIAAATVAAHTASIATATRKSRPVPDGAPLMPSSRAKPR